MTTTPTPPILDRTLPTRMEGSGGTLANLARISYRGDQGRTQFIVTNTTAGSYLLILDRRGAVAGVCYGERSWTVETSDTFQLYNNYGSPVGYYVAEIYPK